MKTRAVYLEYEKAFTAAQTLNIPIDIVDPVVAMTIIVSMTNGAAMTEASTVKPHDEFTKIEVIDGSDTLWTGNMEEIQAYNAFLTKQLPYMGLTLEDDAVQVEECVIMFGLSMHDKNRYLRPTDFRNPVLRITNTLTTPAVTAWAASGHTITVIAHVIEEGAETYEGFVSFKSMYAYDAEDGAIETIDMDNEYQYMGLLVQAFKTATMPQENIEHIKLTCDTDRFIPVDIDADHLQILNRDMFGYYTQKLQKRMKAAGDIMYGDLFFDTWADAGGGVTLVATHVTSVDADQIVVETLGQT